jgi:chromate reductase, NAD(P)H dehydrogenase (quinone)
MATRKVAVIVGSIRKGSLNRMMAHALAALAPASLELEIVEIAQLPLYNQDLDSSPPDNQDLDSAPPAEWTAFRQKIKAADAVLFVTPEHNRSVPAALKNAIDVGSRPYGSNSWGGKPAAIVSVSPGAIGGFGANHHLRQSLVFLNMPPLQQPETYIGGAAKLFDDDGKLVNPGTAEFLKKFMQAFAAWIDTVIGA